MRSPTQAILWEIWARNRRPLIFAWALLVLSVVFVCLANLLAPTRPTQEVFGPILWSSMFSFLSALMSMATLFWVFSFTSVDQNGRFAGFPSWLFTRPIRTARAVSLPMIAGLAMISLAYAGWFALLFHIFERRSVPTPWDFFFWQLLMLCTAFVAMQLFIWLLYPFRYLRILLLCALLLACFWCWVRVPLTDSFRVQPGFSFGVAGTVLIACALGAFKVVAWDRAGGWQHARAPRFAWLRRGAGDFTSIDRALVWFESRRRAVFAAIVLGGTTGLTFWLWRIPSVLSNGQLPSHNNPFFWFTPIVGLSLAGVIGAGLGKPDFWSPEIALPGFQATRPVTTARMVFAKLRVALRVLVFAWCVMFLVLTWHIFKTIWIDADDRFWGEFLEVYPQLWSWLTHPVVLITFAAIQWHALLENMAIIMSGDSRRIRFRNWGRVAKILIGVAVVLWFSLRPGQWELFLAATPVLAVMLAGWKVFATVRTFRTARPLLTSAEHVKLWTIWSALVLGILFSAWSGAKFGAIHSGLLWLIAALFLPGDGLPRCVTNLARNRHR
jgi:hypothetical protein